MGTGSAAITSGGCNCSPGGCQLDQRVSEGDICKRIADLARSLHSSPPDPADTFPQRIVDYAVHAVPGAQYAGITVATSQNQIRTSAATHKFPVLLDDIQRQHQEGPCFGAAWLQHTVRIDHLGTEARWPNYRRDALSATPIKSVVSFRLFTSDQTIGALSLYADTAYAFDRTAEEVGYVLAAHAALAWDTVRREDHFRTALASRDLIGQAKGILIARLAINADSAFELLKRLSQEHNMKLVDVARRVTDAGNIEAW